MHQRISLLACLSFIISTLTSFALALPSEAGKIHVGGASISITPDEPVALSGQMHTRIAHDVESEVTATALALQTRNGNQVVDEAIFVSCDLVAIREGVLEKVRERLKQRLQDFDPQKLVLNATHTHTGPVVQEGIYELPSEGVMRPSEYGEFLADRIAEVAAQAWELLKLGSVGWGLGHAVVGHNRRSVYADGRAVMYGKTNAPDFRGIEGPEDHGVEVLFFWNDQDKLIATAVNVACPAQEVEGRSAINADFWHPIRETLRDRYGKNLFVLGWTGASGDQSPRLMYREEAEDRMRKLRGLSRLEELSHRVINGWEDAYAGAKQEKHTDVPFKHAVETIELPPRQVTAGELAEVQAKIKELSPDPRNRRRVAWHQAVVDRYAREQAAKAQPYQMELHALRLGDIAIATNDFELFTQFGIQMKARSKALQTFLIQLAGPGTYVATQSAVDGGGYSAIVESNEVGPEGGQLLVEQTVESLNSLWEEDESQQSPQTSSVDEKILNDVYPATAENPRYSEGSIITLKDGSILYATTEFIGSDSDFAKARIIAKTSSDGGKSWSPSRVLQENVGELNVMSVSLKRFEHSDPSTIGMFYLVKNSHDDLDVMLRISKDEAETFGEPILVTDQPGYYVMNNDRVLQLADGRLLCPVAWTSDVSKENHFVSSCFFSDDDGQTWQAGEGRVDLPKRGAMEPEVIELADGHVLMIVRTQFPEIYASYSSDRGNTWSQPKPWGVQAPESPATLRRIPSTSDLVLIWNPHYEEGVDHNGKRTPLVAAISRDEGKTWSQFKTLENREDQTYAYTSLIFAGDRALVSYYIRDEGTGRIASRFRSLPIDWFYEEE